jgi:hypothetical protein
MPDADLARERVAHKHREAAAQAARRPTTGRRTPRLADSLQRALVEASLLRFHRTDRADARGER